MRMLRSADCLVLILAACMVLVVTGCASWRQQGPYPVERVVDGVTIEVRIEGRPTPIHIDDLELVMQNEGQAVTRLSEMVLGREVKLVFPLTGAARDAHGRLRARVFVDGADLGDEMISYGIAERETVVSEGAVLAFTVGIVAASLAGLALMLMAL